jgi:hypothetical protein
MRTRDRVHRLVDTLPENELAAVERFLRDLREDGDPFLRALANAAEDDEPLTPNEEAAIAEGTAAIARGDTVSGAELRRALGR